MKLLLHYNTDRFSYWQNDIDYELISGYAKIGNFGTALSGYSSGVILTEDPMSPLYLRSGSQNALLSFSGRIAVPGDGTPWPYVPLSIIASEGTPQVTEVFYEEQTSLGFTDLSGEVPYSLARVNISRVTVTNFGAGPVPEPATWTMLLLGFGAIGGALRRRSRSTGRTLATPSVG